MRKTYCDCCGVLIPDNPPACIITPGVELDLCQECRELAEDIDLWQAAVYELQRMRDDRLRAEDASERYQAERETQEQQAEPETKAAPPLVGPAAKEKRAILERLERVRGKLGLNTIYDEAEAKGMHYQNVMKIMLHEKVPMDQWRKLDAILKALEGGGDDE